MKEAGINNMAAYIRKMAVDGYVVRLDLSDVKEVSRLLRINANKGITLIDDLVQKGVKVHVLNMGMMDDTPTGTDRTHPRGDRNLYRQGSQGTVRGSRVQNREIEDGGYRMPEIGFR